MYVHAYQYIPIMYKMHICIHMLTHLYVYAYVYGHMCAKMYT